MFQRASCESSASIQPFGFNFVDLFLAVLGLRCCARAVCSCSVRAPRCSGFSLKSMDSRHTGSVVVAVHVCLAVYVHERAQCPEEPRAQY